MNYDTKKLGENLKNRRKEKFSADNEKFSYCQTQQLLADEVPSNKKDSVDRRTVLNWENGNSLPTLEQFVRLCELLECDADYLLGKTETPLKTVDDISREIGISNKSIEYIKGNESLQEMIDFILLSPEIKTIMREIDNNSMMQHISEDILGAYEEPLYNKIYRAYKRFNIETLALDKTVEKYKDYLMDEIPYSGIIKSTDENPNALEKYLRKNLSKDRRVQIDILMEDKEDKSEVEKYNIFIDDTAECTYEILEYVTHKELQMNRIAESFLHIIERFIDKKIFNRRENFKKYAQLLRKERKK